MQKFGLSDQPLKGIFGPKATARMRILLEGRVWKASICLGNFLPTDLLLLNSLQHLWWCISESFKILRCCVLRQALVIQTPHASFIHWYSQFPKCAPLQILTHNLRKFSSFKTHLRVYISQSPPQPPNIGNVSSPSTLCSLSLPIV